MYSQNILNIFSNPKNTGRITKPDGIAEAYNEDETQHVEFSLRIEMGIITDCQFRAQANPFVVAVCSTITEMVKNKMAAMLILDGSMVKAELGEPENETNIDFCIDCVRDAVEDYKKKIKKADKQAHEEKSADEHND